MLNMGKNQAKINHRKQANKHGGNGQITEFAFLKPPDSSFRFIIRSLRILSCFFSVDVYKYRQNFRLST